MSEHNSAKAIGYLALLFVIIFAFVRWFYGGPKTFLKVLIWDAWLVASWYGKFVDDPIYDEGPGSASSIWAIIIFGAIILYTTFIWQGNCWAEQ